jgi:hypothetical protein
MTSVVFDIVIAVAFQSTFRLKMHQKKYFFYFLKNSLLSSIHQNDSKTLNFFYFKTKKKTQILTKARLAT